MKFQKFETICQKNYVFEPFEMAKQQQTNQTVMYSTI